MVAAAVRPRAAAHDVPPRPDVVHYPLNVPIPATRAAGMVALHDIRHHDLPDLFSCGDRAYRRWADDRGARSANLVITGT